MSCLPSLDWAYECAVRCLLLLAGGATAGENATSEREDEEAGGHSETPRFPA